VASDSDSFVHVGSASGASSDSDWERVSFHNSDSSDEDDDSMHEDAFDMDDIDLTSENNMYNFTNSPYTTTSTATVVPTTTTNISQNPTVTSTTSPYNVASLAQPPYSRNDSGAPYTTTNTSTNPYTSFLDKDLDTAPVQNDLYSSWVDNDMDEEALLAEAIKRSLESYAETNPTPPTTTTNNNNNNNSNKNNTNNNNNNNKSNNNNNNNSSTQSKGLGYTTASPLNIQPYGFDYINVPTSPTPSIASPPPPSKKDEFFMHERLEIKPEDPLEAIGTTLKDIVTLSQHHVLTVRQLAEMEPQLLQVLAKVPPALLITHHSPHFPRLLTVSLRVPHLSL
jgi:hypothetical protein